MAADLLIGYKNNFKLADKDKVTHKLDSEHKCLSQLNSAELIICIGSFPTIFTESCTAPSSS